MPKFNFDRSVYEQTCLSEAVTVQSSTCNMGSNHVKYVTTVALLWVKTSWSRSVLGGSQHFIFFACTFPCELYCAREGSTRSGRPRAWNKFQPHNRFRPLVACLVFRPTRPCTDPAIYQTEQKARFRKAWQGPLPGDVTTGYAGRRWPEAAGEC